MTSRTLLAILAVLALAIVGWFSVGRTAPVPLIESGDYARGPRGARLLSADGLQLEVTIFETGVPPHFRIYPYDNAGAPLAPTAVTLTVELRRLGNRVDRITFVPEADYLLGQQVVEEPHSFDVALTATHGGRQFSWTFSSVEGKVQLTDAVLKSTGIEVWTVGPRDITTTVALPGQIVADETRVAHVSPPLAGAVTSVQVRVGDRVRRGDVLAVLHSRELADARSAYLFATHHTEFARATATREEALWKKKISAERDYLSATRDAEEAALAEATARQKLLALGDSPAFLDGLAAAPADTLPRFEVRAPADGLVLERDVVVGESVDEGATLFVVGDLGHVFVETSMDAAALSGLRAGQVARLTTTGADHEAEARVSYISPRIDPDTRRGTVRLSLANPDGRWRPGLFVTAHLVQSRVTAAMAIPIDAVQTFRDWQVAFFRFGDWFEARPLELGRSDGRWVEVIAGLAPGDRYAATNSFAIKAEIGKLGATHDH